jgi:hypothetical protein
VALDVPEHPRDGVPLSPDLAPGDIDRRADLAFDSRGHVEERKRIQEAGGNQRGVIRERPVALDIQRVDEGDETIAA